MNIKVSIVAILLLILGGCTSSSDTRCQPNEKNCTASTQGVQVYGSVGTSMEYQK